MFLSNELNAEMKSFGWQINYGEILRIETVKKISNCDISMRIICLSMYV